jgi:GH25 family lysozyme M1 (1,4-beta-N-acetylmuramidase)
MTRTGVDISHWQSTFVPSTYKAAGEDFVILKCTDGTNYVDPTFKARWAASKAAGVPRGAYHFARPSRSGADAQADYFVKTLRAAGFGDRDTWALDLEDEKSGLGAATLTAWADRFCDRVKAALGGPGLFYSYVPYIRGTMGNPGKVPGGCLAWVARYGPSPYAAPYPRPAGWPDPPDVWQCSNGEVGCVKSVASVGKCDYNRMTDGAYSALFSAEAAPAAEWWQRPLGVTELQQLQQAFTEALK